MTTTLRITWNNQNIGRFLDGALINEDLGVENLGSIRNSSVNAALTCYGSENLIIENSILSKRLTIEPHASNKYQTVTIIGKATKVADICFKGGNGQIILKEGASLPASIKGAPHPKSAEIANFVFSPSVNGGLPIDILATTMGHAYHPNLRLVCKGWNAAYLSCATEFLRYFKNIADEDVKLLVANTEKLSKLHQFIQIGRIYSSYYPQTRSLFGKGDQRIVQLSASHLNFSVIAKLEHDRQEKEDKALIKFCKTLNIHNPWFNLGINEMEAAANAEEQTPMTDTQKATFLRQRFVASEFVKTVTRLSCMEDRRPRRFVFDYFPPEIGLFTSATRLNFSDHDLESLPNEIGKLVKLTSLVFSSNKLRSLPSEIGNLVLLGSLNLANNELETLPEEIGNLKNLKELCLAKNKITFLPKQIGNLSRLEHFNLRVNRIKSLPDEITNLTQLISLNINHNPIEPGSLSTKIEKFLKPKGVFVLGCW